MLLATAGASTDERANGSDGYESYEWTIRAASDHRYVLRIDKRVFDEDGMELGRFTVEINLPGRWTRPAQGA